MQKEMIQFIKNIFKSKNTKMLILSIGKYSEIYKLSNNHFVLKYNKDIENYSREFLTIKDCKFYFYTKKHIKK